MQWQFAGDSPNNVYLHCEIAAASPTLVRGDWVLWDMVDNTAVSGINRETRGYRVTAIAGGTSVTSTRVAGVVENVPQAYGTSSTKGTTFLVQCHGFHDSANVNVTADQATAGYGLVMSTTAAQAREVKAGDELVSIIGACLSTAGLAASGSQLLPCLVKTIGG